MIINNHNYLCKSLHHYIELNTSKNQWNFKSCILYTLPNHYSVKISWELRLIKSYDDNDF